jgi:anti-sigma regulatory factor (Ser/Thr protein kinase)
MVEDRDPPLVETDLPGTVTAPREARAFLRSTLQTWNLDGFGELTELLTDEIVSNVVRHVGAGMRLRAIRHPGAIRVEVDDSSGSRPTLRHPGTDDDRGRGLMLVDELSDRWGTDFRSDGKTVWFELDVDTATHEVHDET